MKSVAAIFFLLTTISAFSQIWEVSPAGKLKSIKRAIEQAQPGDTIRVTKGLYKEGNIIVNKAVTLLGIDYPVVDGERKHEVFTITANNVSITGFNVVNVGVASLRDLSAIAAENVKNLYIAFNKIENAFFGIHFANCKNSLIEGNTLKTTADVEQTTGNGIHMWKSDGIIVRNNSVDGHRDGLYFEFVTNSVIEKNTSQQNLRYGLHFMFSHDNEYNHNLFKSNGAGIAVMYSHGVKMRYNRFEENWGASVFGLLLKEISESTIEHNLF